ncbi:Spo0E like sporulation regulatory protein [Paraliobacillus sp. PM-2]|uniref:aspartyl-phosphate phosphatase Spo0E family protein n=1 Tax=Paraliobacillus sp. PM-2 TaxID=1462524 RepID=UPI00061C9273|nr:aspartyl-phosphate phosphatase Spo0E family protein [Paraliobacillus sp. PM-2]CQR47854.1 Spo0E like sporulation regulatory protein [Paraliobacillus sp. PM-2]
MSEHYTKYLLSQIELIRKSMVEIALSQGFTSKESIHLSQELDNLLNQYEIEKETQ